MCELFVYITAHPPSINKNPFGKKMHREVVHLCCEALRSGKHAASIAELSAVLREPWARMPSLPALAWLMLVDPSGLAWWGWAPAIWSWWGITTGGHPGGHVALHTPQPLPLPRINKGLDFNVIRPRDENCLLRLNPRVIAAKKEASFQREAGEAGGYSRWAPAGPGGYPHRGGAAPAPVLWPHRDYVEDGTARSLSNYDQVSSILKFTFVCLVVNWGLVDRFLLFATLLIEMNVIKKNSWMCK